jgi:hypothetical protein
MYIILLYFRHQVKANPLDRKVLIPHVHKSMLAVKTPTKFEPFKLSQGKRKEVRPNLFLFVAMIKLMTSKTERLKLV